MFPPVCVRRSACVRRSFTVAAVLRDRRSLERTRQLCTNATALRKYLGRACMQRASVRTPARTPPPHAGVRTSDAVLRERSSVCMSAATTHERRSYARSALVSRFAQRILTVCAEMISSASMAAAPHARNGLRTSRPCRQGDPDAARFFACFKLQAMTLRHLRSFGRQVLWCSDNQRPHARGLRCLHYLNTSSMG